MTRLYLCTVLWLVASLVGCDTSRTTMKPRRVLASVDGAPIYADEFSAELDRVLNTDQGLPSAETQSVQKRVLLQELINQRVLLKAADDAKVVVGMDAVEAGLNAAKQGWKQDTDDCDDCSFDNQLAQKKLTLRDFRSKLRESILIRKYFREHVFARIAVTDAEIEAYIEKNPEVSKQPETVRAKHIVVKTAAEAKQIERELRGGLSFEDAAIKYSHGPHAKTGGDLGSFRRGVMPSLFDEVCFALQPGKVSKPVPSDRGFHLFKVEEHSLEGEKPFALVKNDVESTIRHEKERLAEKETIQRLRNAATIEVKKHALAELR